MNRCRPPVTVILCQAFMVAIRGPFLRCAISASADFAMRAFDSRLWRSSTDTLCQAMMATTKGPFLRFTRSAAAAVCARLLARSCAILWSSFSRSDLPAIVILCQAFMVQIRGPLRRCAISAPAALERPEDGS